MLDPKWSRGVLLGRAWNSDANSIGLASGQITTARAITRTTLPERWSKERIQRVTGTPMNLSLAYDDAVEEDHAPHRGPDGHRDDGPDTDEPIPQPREDNADDKAVRRMHMRRRDMLRHGYSLRPVVSSDGRRCQLLRDGQFILARSHDHTE